MSIAAVEAREASFESAGGGLWGEAWVRLRRNPGAIAGFVIVTAIVVMAIFAPLIAPYGPRDQNLDLIKGGCCPGPSAEHLFGVDQLGRDEFSRIVYGARYSLIIGVVSVSVAFIVGSILGAVLLATIDGGLNMVNASIYVYDVVRGAILVLAMLADAFGTRLSNERALRAVQAAR